MRLKVCKSRYTTSLYVIKSTYDNGVRSTKEVERLGTVKELAERLGGRDPIEWANEYIAELNRKEAEGKRKIRVEYSPSAPLAEGDRHLYNGGYLFLQKLYHELGIDGICKKISQKYEFEYDLNAILSRLIYSNTLSRL